MSNEDEDTPTPPADLIDQRTPVDLDGIDRDLTGENFRAWRREQEFRKNLRNDNAEYNNGGFEVTPERHSPHTVAQCARKQWYRENNAIQETAPPDGIFTIGSLLEEEFVEPWLDALAAQHGGYVTNGIWMEETVETDVADVQELTLAGKTDPAIVDTDGVPHAITECKSKQSLSAVNDRSDISEHHKAQLHCYLYAAQQQYDVDPVGYIIYIGRKKMQVEVFRVEFNEDFFRENVVEWAESLTFCRMEGILPGADPCQYWECNLCEFRGRCGNYDPDDDERDLPWKDIGADGMLPLYDYPLEAVIEYLRANEDVKLTPTVAHNHPELTDMYDVHDWVCPRCSASYAWDTFQDRWDGNPEFPPWCPDCADDGMHAELSGPTPEDQ